jgi:hypothetical protein
LERFRVAELLDDKHRQYEVHALHLRRDDGAPVNLSNCLGWCTSTFVSVTATVPFADPASAGDGATLNLSFERALPLDDIEGDELM